MWSKWFPWRFIIRKVAQKQGFLDPIAFFSKIQRFAQPSEVAYPIEIVRLATVLQARGFLNTQAIQHNLDWIWPYWVVRQFDPRDRSFIPRAFSLTHINLTHRNWTAVGIPGMADYPLVDPRGLLTPFYDGWSLDTWVIDQSGHEDLFPSKADTVSQQWDFGAVPTVCTHSTQRHVRMVSRVSVERCGNEPYCVMKVEASSPDQAWLVIALRPFNPEGVSEVESVKILETGLAWEINKKQRFYFRELPDRHYFSHYQEGDVYRKINLSRFHREFESSVSGVECPSGMATAAALFRIPPGGKREIEVQIPLHVKNLKSAPGFVQTATGEAEQDWKRALEGHCELHVQDSSTEYLYKAALETLILHTPGREAFPGPYTYKHFWFRDAAFILHALLAANLPARAEEILDHFPARQSLTGYFKSQDGEWDSNGQVLWIFRRFAELTGVRPKDAWKDALHKGTKWIEQKRLSENLKKPHAGLFPAGYSAEHLGPNDYYYWDDFWGVEGLVSAAYLMKLYGEEKEALRYKEEAGRFTACIERSLAQAAKRLNTQAMPASPYRRLDTGAIGSLAAGYPLHFWAPGDPRVMQTVEYLLGNHFINGGFFHDMSHSGINPYLTLAVAQILLRNQDERYADILRNVQKIASGTGQWPEAVHPQTLGGCMGDGQHVWAAAEWVLMIRNCFVREEEGRLLFCSGVLPEWYGENAEISFGKTTTPYGPVRLRLRKEGAGVRVSWEAEWRGHPPAIEVRLPGYEPVDVRPGEFSATLSPRKAL